MANFNVSDAKKSPQIVIRDAKGDVLSVVTPKDLQVGFEGSPGALILKGALDISAKIVDVTNANQTNIKVSTDTVAYFIRNSSGQNVNVKLPSPAANLGQVHIVKDFSGTATNPPLIVVSTADNSLIDGFATQSIGVAFGAIMFVWMGESWVSLALGASGAGGGAPSSARYVVWSTEAGLPNSRVLSVVPGELTIDTTSPNATLGLPEIGTPGTFNFPSSITTDANGRVTSITTGGQFPAADKEASYVVMSLTASLPNERQLVNGTGINMADGGPSSTVTLSIDDDTVATISGSTFTGIVKFNVGLSGSLQRLTSDISYLVAGPGIHIQTQSNGQIFITASATSPQTADADFVIGANRLYTTSTVAFTTDAQFADNYGVDNFFFVSGTVGLRNSSAARRAVFGGDVVVSGGLSGSLQQLPNGQSYLVAGAGINVITQSNGQILLSSPPTDDADFVIGTNRIRTTASVAISTDALFADQYGVDNFFYVSGTVGLRGAAGRRAVFGGDVVVSGGLSGSLQQLPNGTSYLVAGPGIFIQTQSNGQIFITASAAAAASGDDPDFVIGNSKIRTTSSVLFGSGTAFADSFGPDIRFYVSGTRSPNLVGNPAGAIAVFGGDVMFSGAHYYHTASLFTKAQKDVFGVSAWQVMSRSATFTASLFSVTDETSGSLFSISNFVNGIPIIDVFSDHRIIMSGTLFFGSGTSTAQVPRYVFFSGTRGITGSNERVVVFSGDTRISGTLLLGTSGSHRISGSGADLWFFDVNNPNGWTLTQLAQSGTSGGGADGADADFVIGFNRIRTTSSVAFGSGTNFAVDYGSGTFFYVSGTRNLGVFSASTATAAAVAVFGGDVLFSSSLFFHTASVFAKAHKDTSGISSISIMSRSTTFTASLFAVTDQISGSLFSISNFVNGIPIVDIFSDHKIVLSGTLFVGSGTSTDVNPRYVFFSGTQGITDSRDKIVVFGGDVKHSGSLAVGQTVAIGSGTHFASAYGADVFFVVSGTTGLVGPNARRALFTGELIASGGLSGSLQRLPTGVSYLVAGNNVTITTQSNGQVVIASTATGGGGGGGSSSTTGSNRVDTDASDIIVWRLNEITGNILLNVGTSGSAAHLTGSNQLVYGRAGVYDSAVDFRGYNIPTFASTSNAVRPRDSDISVSAWIYPYQFHSGVVVMKNFTTATYDPLSPIILGVTGAWGNPYVQIRTTNATSNLLVIEDSRSLDVYDWNHIGFSLSGSGTSMVTRLYVNGDFVRSMIVSGVLNYSGTGTGGWWSVGGVPGGAEAGDYKLNDIRVANIVRDDQWWRDIYVRGLRGGLNQAANVTGTWRDPGNTFVATGSVSIDSQNRTVDQIGSDIYFFVSGTQGITGSQAKVASFGGDVRISGSLLMVDRPVGWMTTYEVDFSKLPDQNLLTGGDGQKTIDGKPWFLSLSSGASLISVSNSVGLIITKNTAGAGWAGQLHLSLSNASPNIIPWEHDLELWFRTDPSRLVASTDELHDCACFLIESASLNSTLEYFFTGRSTGNNIGWRMDDYYGGTRTGIYGSTAFDTPAHDVHMYRIIGGWLHECWTGVWTNNTWPSSSQMYRRASSRMQETSARTQTSANLPKITSAGGLRIQLSVYSNDTTAMSMTVRNMRVRGR